MRDYTLGTLAFLGRILAWPACNRGLHLHGRLFLPLLSLFRQPCAHHPAFISAPERAEIADLGLLDGGEWCVVVWLSGVNLSV